MFYKNFYIYFYVYVIMEGNQSSSYKLIYLMNSKM